MSNESNIHDECESRDCFVPSDRRRFLKESFLAVTGALVAVGMTKADAFAMPLQLTEALRAAGSTRSYAIPAADGAQIDKDNDVILVRWQGSVFAFNLSCPHQNTALKWDDKRKTFECPKHHSEFQADGSYIKDSGRATRNMDRFAIVRSGPSISVDLDKLYQEDTDTALWSTAVVKA